MSTDQPDKPLGVISSTDQSGLLSIMTALALCFVLVSYAIRIYVRHSKGLWKLDDNILTAATILSCIQASIVFYEVHIGLGKTSIMTSDGPDNKSLCKFHYANNYLYILTLLFSKASIGFLYLRLTRARGHIIATWIIQGCCAAWAVAAFLLVGVGVGVQDAFEISFWRWVIVGITDCITDALLVLMSVYLVKDLRMTVVQKGTVVFAFALRLLTIPAIAIRLYYLNPSTLTSNRTLAISLSIVCTQLELGYGIMAASITVLKPFMAVYEKSPNGTSYGRATHGGYYTANTGKGSYKLGSVDSVTTSTTPSPGVGGETNSPIAGKRPGSNNRNSSIGATRKFRPLTSANRDALDFATVSQTGSMRSPTASYSAAVSHWEPIDTQGGGGGNNGGGSTIASTMSSHNMGGTFGHKKKNSSRLEKTESIHSQDSRKMIIERKTDWSIRYEDPEEDLSRHTSGKDSSSF